MDVPQLDVKALIESAVVVVLVVALLQYLGGLLLDSSWQISPLGLALLGGVYVLLSVAIATITVNTSLLTFDRITKDEQ